MGCFRPVTLRFKLITQPGHIYNEKLLQKDCFIFFDWNFFSDPEQNHRECFQNTPWLKNTVHFTLFCISRAFFFKHKTTNKEKVVVFYKAFFLNFPIIFLFAGEKSCKENPCQLFGVFTRHWLEFLIHIHVILYNPRQTMLSVDVWRRVALDGKLELLWQKDNWRKSHVSLEEVFKLSQLTVGFALG